MAGCPLPISLFLMKISFFYLYLFNLHPLFPDHNCGVKQGLGVEGPVTVSLFICHSLQGVQFIACLQSNSCTTLTSYNTTDNNSFNSTHKTHLHFRSSFLTGRYRLLVVNIGQLDFHVSLLQWSKFLEFNVYELDELGLHNMYTFRK